MNRAELIAHSFGQPPAPENATPDESIEIKLLVPPTIDDVLCHVGVSWRVVDTVAGEHRLAGVCLVCTDPAWQQKGLMRKAMEIAHEVARRRGISTAGLFTDRPELYRGLGYVRLQGDGLPEHFMVASLRSPLLIPSIVDTRGTW